MSNQTRVVVLGSGFGGLQAAFALRHSVAHVNITVVSKSTELFYGPGSLYIPFGLDPDTLRIPIADVLRKKHIEFLHAAVTAIDSQGRTVVAGEQHIPYDFLIIATGSRCASVQVPGLVQHGLDLTAVWQLIAMRRAFAQLVADVLVGRSRRVLFVLPPGNLFPGPLFEMALMLDTWLSRQDYRKSVSLEIATWETSFLQVFGTAVHDALDSLFHKRGIEAHTCWTARRVTDRSVMFGDSVADYDLLVYSPALAGALGVPGLPYDEHGFVRSVPSTRQVEGHSNIFVVGDSASDPGLKEAYVAFNQADVAVAQIVAMVGGMEPTHTYHPHSRYILDTMDSGLLVEGRLGDDSLLEPAHVASSRLWHIGKRLLGRYLPWKLRCGEPFSDLLARPGDEEAPVASPWR